MTFNDYEYPYKFCKVERESLGIDMKRKILFFFIHIPLAFLFFAAFSSCTFCLL